MNCSTFIHVALLLVAVSFHSSADAKRNPRSLYSKVKFGQIPPLRCINIGSNEDDGVFMSEQNFVRYNAKKDVSEPTNLGEVKIKKSIFESAFRAQRSGDRIFFHIRVKPGYTYSGSLGFAQTEECEVGLRVFRAIVGKQRFRRVDVVDRIGCGFSYLIQFKNAVPNRFGLIMVIVKPDVGVASLSTLCINGVKPIVIEET